MRFHVCVWNDAVRMYHCIELDGHCLSFCIKPDNVFDELHMTVCVHDMLSKTFKLFIQFYIYLLMRERAPPVGHIGSSFVWSVYVYVCSVASPLILYI